MVSSLVNKKRTFNSRLLILIGILVVELFAGCNKDQNSDSIDSLRLNFHAPPLEARPRALWTWVEGNFSLDEITREMEEASEKGLGGFEIWDVKKVVDENNIVPSGPSFMSDEYMKGIIHAIEEAERLGLDLGLVIASGWNAGGSWTKPENRTMGLYSSEKNIIGPMKFNDSLEFPELPKYVVKKNRRDLAIRSVDHDNNPCYYKEISVLAMPNDDEMKIISKSDIIDLTEYYINGRLEYRFPVGNWKIKRYIMTNTGQPMISSSESSRGPMIDHFNERATEFHINFFINKIEKYLGKPIKESGLKYLYADSYEVTGALWTESFVQEFQQRKGYSIIPFLPVLDGFVVENEDITNRFLYDFREILSDLIIENHYKKATEICEQNGIGFIAEAAGPGQPVHDCPFESIKSSGSLTIPRGEFWHVSDKSNYWKDLFSKEKRSHYLEELQVIKGVASASHLYTQKYVEAEAFTGIQMYSEGPGDLKPTLDRAFCEGLNRVVFHTWPHTPEKAGTPGWSYSFGTLFHENRIWWKHSQPWLEYIGRSSFMLQQGNFVGDVLYFYGDSTPNFVPAKKIDPLLGFGYDYDVTNTEILVNKLFVENGKLKLENGQEYNVLVLPDVNYMVYEVLFAIEKLIKDGATVIGAKPQRSHGLKDWQEHDKKVIDLADKIWGDCDGQTITEKKYGKGKIIWGKSIRDVLVEKNVIPDFSFTGNIDEGGLDYIHRKMDFADIYFIRNRRKAKIHGEATFRVSDRQPELWDPVTGKMKRLDVFSITLNKTIIPIELDAHESLFFVFQSEEIQDHMDEIYKEEVKIFPTQRSTFKSQPFISFYKALEENKMTFNEIGEYTFYSNKKECNKYTIKEQLSDTISFFNPWIVYFPEEAKGVGEILFDTLYSWSRSDNLNIKFFSGIATYNNSFYLPDNIELNKNNIELVLGSVYETAMVYINDSLVGTSWIEPNKLIINDQVVYGVNKIKIEVANTWHNRLCRDAKLPVSERLSKSNVTRLPTPWSYSMEDIPFKNQNEEYDLLESGLIGPVYIRLTENYNIW